MNELQILQELPVIQHLSAKRREEMLAEGLLERYEKGAVLFRQGEEAAAIWFILSGWVHLVRASTQSEDGVVIFTVTPDEMLCGVSAITSDRYNVSAVAGTACTAFQIPANIFDDALRHEPEAAYDVAQLCIRRMRHIAQQYGAMAEPVASRIVRTILRLRTQFGNTLPVTHRELAQMSWTTTESAIRSVRRLKHDGYLKGARGSLTVRDANALARLVQEGNGHNGLAPVLHACHRG